MQQLFSEFGVNSWSWITCAFTLFLLWGVSRTLEWVWFRPRRLERMLRKQGLHGTMYRPLVGDLKEESRLSKEARSKPMPFSHDIAPRVAPMLHLTMKKFGKMSITWFGPYPRVTINDPDLVREILSNKFENFGQQKLGRLPQLLIDGVLIYEGEKWIKHRRILNPVFHVEKLKMMLPAFCVCCEELISRWESSVGPNGSFELDVWQAMQNFTAYVISRTVFGTSYEDGRRISRLQGEQADRLFKAFPTLVLPFNWYLPIENIKRMKQNAREVQTLLMDIIVKREKAIWNGETAKDDLLDILLESNIKAMGRNGKTNSQLGMTTDEVIAECKLLYFAGQESTSVLLTWTMVLLSIHPEWQQKAREEVLQHFGTEKPDFDGLSRLKIVTMILYEVLRLYPPAGTLTRFTYKSAQLGDVIIPPGVILAMPMLFIHRDADIWGPDATEFKPTRFEEGISKATKNGQLAFFPFGWGPRICLGQNFALLEAKMGLSMILQHFKFELSEKYQHAPYTIFTIHPEHGAPIKFYKI